LQGFPLTTGDPTRNADTRKKFAGILLAFSSGISKIESNKRLNWASMEQLDCRKKLITAATPLFARKGLHGTNVRELARAAGVHFSMISYHFGSKNGLYAAVLEEQFASLRYIARVAGMAIFPREKLRTYVYQCGICFHEAGKGEFTPFTAGADRGAPECPRCLNNDGALFAEIAVVPEREEQMRKPGRRTRRKRAEVVHG
jgi:hypothetical protein